MGFTVAAERFTSASPPSRSTCSDWPGEAPWTVVEDRVVLMSTVALGDGAVLFGTAASLTDKFAGLSVGDCFAGVLGSGDDFLVGVAVCGAGSATRRAYAAFDVAELSDFGGGVSGRRSRCLAASCCGGSKRSPLCIKAQRGLAHSEPSRHSFRGWMYAHFSRWMQRRP